MDPFTLKRLQQTLSSFKHTHGRDASESDLVKAGFDKSQLQKAVKDGLVKKYQTTVGNGQVENRFKWMGQGALKI